MEALFVGWSIATGLLHSFARFLGQLHGRHKWCAIDLWCILQYVLVDVLSLKGGLDILVVHI
jgi:hypothetical protein